LIFERNADANYVKVVGATSGPVNPVPGCPGFVIDRHALWVDLARLADPEGLEDV
jgi:hypothetical protein